MDPLLKILGAHPLSTLLLLALLAVVWPEVLTTAEKALAVLTIVGLGLLVAVPLEVWSRIRRRGHRRPAPRQPMGHTSGLSGNLCRQPRPTRRSIHRPTRATRKRA
jgi:hypothetical protein